MRYAYKYILNRWAREPHEICNQENRAREARRAMSETLPRCGICGKRYIVPNFLGTGLSICAYCSDLRRKRELRIAAQRIEELEKLLVRVVREAAPYPGRDRFVVLPADTIAALRGALGEEQDEAE